MANLAEIPSSRPRWLLVVGALLLLAVLAAGFVPFAHRQYTEPDLYALAGARMRAGKEIYRLNERSFAYPPLLAVPGVLLSYLPVLGYRFAWYLCVCATLALVVGLVMRRVWEAGSGERSGWLFWVLVLVLAGRHLLSPVENQSHDLLIFLCVLLALDAWSRPGGRFPDAQAGVWAGMATALKATPLLLLPLFVWQCRWRAVAAMVLAGVGLTLATDLLWPRQDGRLWSVAWFETFLNRARPGDLATTPTWDPWGPLNQSLSGSMQRLLTRRPAEWPAPADEFNVSLLALSPEVMRCVTLAGLASVCGWMLWVSRPSVTRGLSDRQRQFLRLGQGGVLVTAMVLMSPTSIKTHFGVLLLPIAVCVADFLWHGQDRLTAGLLAVVFLAGTLTSKDIVGREAGNAIMTAGSVTLVALALLAATGRVVLLRSRQWHGEAKAIAVNQADPVRSLAA